MGLMSELRKKRMLSEGSYGFSSGTTIPRVPNDQMDFFLQPQMVPPAKTHAGSRGIEFEDYFKYGLHLLGLEGLFSESSATAPLWDVNFHPSSVWARGLAGHRANVKNAHTDWVGGIGSLNRNLPWDQKSRESNKHLKDIIRAWVSLNNFDSLYLIKPKDDEFEAQFLGAIKKIEKWGGSQHGFLHGLFASANWRVALLGDVFDIQLNRDKSGMLLSFAILRQYPKIDPADELPYEPEQLGLINPYRMKKWGLGPGQSHMAPSPTWDTWREMRRQQFGESLLAEAGDHNFVSTHRSGDRRWLRAASSNIFRARTSILSSSW